MLKKRIIPVLSLMNGRLVKTRGFESHRDVGDPVASARIYNSQYADELVFLNINRQDRTVEPLLSLIENVSKVCFMPLAFGGGIKTADDAAKLVRAGADKVVINSACYRNYSIISQIASVFGSQAIVVSIDVRRTPSGDYALFSNCGRNQEEISLRDHIRKCKESGAGEILITSIDHDGQMTGYDLHLIKRTIELSQIPVIASGGAGTYEHLREAFAETDVSATACASLFNFGDNNPIRAKAHLTNYGFNFKKV